MARLILGEATRMLDPRFRLSIPPELAEALAAGPHSRADAKRGSTAVGAECVLAKERPGCLSLWNAADWKTRLDDGVQLVESKIQAGRLEGRLEEVQRLGRMLSTRHRPVQLAGRGRLIVPEGFREFLGVEPGGTVMIIGAAVCIEIWHTERWSNYIGDEMPAFRRLLDQLSS